MSEPNVLWQLDRRGASLKCGPLDAHAGCLPDGLDFIVRSWNGKKVEGVNVLISRGPREQSELLEITDLYVRSNDLVGSFAHTPTQRIAPQVYWRANHRPTLSAVSIEQVLSVHTDLLDSAPSWEISSSAHGAKVFHAGDLGQPTFEDVTVAASSFRRAPTCEHLFVFRMAAAGLSYAQMVHPSDFVSADISFDGDQPRVLNSVLFPDRLEKGVIRRARVCGWFMPVEHDLETAVKLARAFVEEPLPLTA